MSSKVALTRVYVEAIHDELVSKYWGFDEPVFANEYRNLALLESAVNRPFQWALGRPVHWTIYSKAAALFHSLIQDHPFRNGNKRTAVIAVDQFLLANGYFLVLSSKQMYSLAKQTAQHNADGISADKMVRVISKLFRGQTVALEKIIGTPEHDRLREMAGKIRKEIRGSNLRV